ncbi:FTR1 family iron permease [Candidatus Methanoperedens nitratireducens]|uniref:High-affinity iron transporter n=1 Tax=Candidatus Methanoperedens nitratireducens TaxID=1392998 RepID=A0A284VT70_9EURY|nr:FTR1 family protein [Candidatus Methanoperedens nitroreducens]SNQ62383.1 High-affinity iron transporter [Candidatus Methanoperedens nitroreducens]
MLASFLITFREALEAALIIGIIAAYLAKIGRKDLYRYLYIGIIGALFASTGVALAFKLIYGELEGTAEELFEGIAALTASAVLTYMIFWMASNSKKIKGDLQEKIDVSISEGQMLGIAALSFISVFREGVETVLFLGTLAITSPLDTLLGFILGVATVVLLSFAMFKGIHRLDVGRFFKYTSILLVLFSAGLIATGVHELNEAGIIPPVVEHVWDLNPPVNTDGTYPALHENGIIGSSLKSLAGYNANPSLTEVIAYIGYWLVIGLFVYRTYRVTAASKVGEVKSYGS